MHVMTCEYVHRLCRPGPDVETQRARDITPGSGDCNEWSDPAADISKALQLISN